MAKTPKTTTAPTGSIAPFGLRMLPELRAKVEESAKDNGRSMNAEIVERLERSFSSTEQPSSEALMLEMRRTQLLLRRSQVQSDASDAFFAGSADAKKEHAHRKTNPDPSEIEEARKGANKARLSASHLRQEVAGIDGRLQEIERRLQELGYDLEFVTADDPTDHPVAVLRKPR